MHRVTSTTIAALCLSRVFSSCNVVLVVVVVLVNTIKLAARNALSQLISRENPIGYRRLREVSQ